MELNKLKKNLPTEQAKPNYQRALFQDESNEIKDNKINEATKGDIFGIIDYLHNGLADYINNPAGRPYDDDEIININTWVQRCCVWLNQQIKEMP